MNERPALMSVHARQRGVPHCLCPLPWRAAPACAGIELLLCARYRAGEQGERHARRRGRGAGLRVGARCVALEARALARRVVREGERLHP